MTKQRAQELLRTSIEPTAEFRDQQWEAIDALVNNQKQILLVQRTGWGKSTVYFIATQLLRNQGAGPTLLISPLLSLMSNQIEDAESQLGLDAVTINSNNTDEWDAAMEAVIEDTCDILLVSPERFSNDEFRTEVLDEMLAEFGLLVVDEAHCISDWGHDFRPDYRRIKRVVEELPTDTPVAATTATANDRVIADIKRQLPAVETIRGTLVRESLRIQTIELGSRANRLAWLAAHIPETDTAGIIYCLTTKDVETVTDWLNTHGMDVEAYHGRLDGDHRRTLEQRLLANDVDAVVATNALGMGFNKPDLGFVIHFQRPPNLIRYYQEIGRAGRQLEEAYAILLAGPSDDDIAEYFIENAFPDPDEFQAVLGLLQDTEEPLYTYQILKRLDIAAGTARTCLDILQLDGAVERVSDGFTATGTTWSYDTERITRVTEQRREELARIQEFVQTDECLTRFVDDALDGDLTADCGFCANCAGAFVPTTVAEDGLLDEAIEYYRTNSDREIAPRKRRPLQGGTYEQIPESEQLEPGRSLSTFGEPGWGRLVETAHTENTEFDDRLVEAAAELVRERWAPEPYPTWITVVPSSTNKDGLSSFAMWLAAHLDLPFVPVVTQTEETDAQAEFANSYQQCWNVAGAFRVTDEVRSDPVLLVDDVVGSRWTLTEVGRRLRQAGSGPVYPFTLADRRGG